MWEKILIIFLVTIALILYALTVHLDQALDDSIIDDHIEFTY